MLRQCLGRDRVGPAGSEQRRPTDVALRADGHRATDDDLLDVPRIERRVLGQRDEDRRQQLGRMAARQRTVHLADGRAQRGCDHRQV